jgi:hypothetical protein
VKNVCRYESALRSKVHDVHRSGKGGRGTHSNISSYLEASNFPFFVYDSVSDPCLALAATKEQAPGQTEKWRSYGRTTTDLCILSILNLNNGSGMIQKCLIEATSL